MLFEEGFTQNRELSWLRYNERVLEEALDERVPLFERLRFIAIFVSNLEEFFKVRVGSLIGEEDEGRDHVDEKSGMTAAEQLRHIHDLVPGLLMKKDMAYSIVEAGLSEAGVVRLEPSQLNEEERGRCFDFFRDKIKRRLDIRILDENDELPQLDEEKPYIIAMLDSEVEDKFGLIDIPRGLPLIYVMPGPFDPDADKEDSSASGSSNRLRYVLTEDIIKMYADTLFVPFVPLEVHVIDIARNAEAAGDSGRANTAGEMREIVNRRKHAPADKLISDGRPGHRLTEYFIKNLDLDYRQIFVTTRIDFSYIDELEDILPDDLRSSLLYPPHRPYDQTSDMAASPSVQRIGFGDPASEINPGASGNILKTVKKHDMLSAYPYDSMDLFLSLLREAVFSEEVKEIRITIYRLAENPKIADYLIYAARNGKKVKAVMELRARFDEERNINWAKKLSAAGCKVCFGTDRYKVHSKLCQLVLSENSGKDTDKNRKEKGKNKKDTDKSRKETYITQISTGNYNEKTAKAYTDFSLVTGDQEIGESVSKLFKDIFRERTENLEAAKIKTTAAEYRGTSYESTAEKAAKSEKKTGGRQKDNNRGRYAPLLVSPANMRSELLRLIRREAAKGERGLIFFKINSLTDEKMIEALMEASCAGCRIRMIVRGICCMLPGIEYSTENVCIVSLVGRFLEHSRVYIFGEGEDELMYISSADIMARNLDRRIEVACPVNDSNIKNRIRGIMYLNYNDTEKGRVMLPDGTYALKPARDDGVSVDSQSRLCC